MRQVVIKTFVLSNFEWSFYTEFYVAQILATLSSCLGRSEFNPYKPNGMSQSYKMDQRMSVTKLKCCWVVFFTFLQILIVYILSRNSGDRDQTPRSAASDLGLYCLPKSIKKGR